MVADEHMVNSYESSGVQWITFRHDWFVDAWGVKKSAPISIVAFSEYTIVSGNGNNRILPLWLHVVRSD